MPLLAIQQLSPLVVQSQPISEVKFATLLAASAASTASAALVGKPIKGLVQIAVALVQSQNRIAVGSPKEYMTYLLKLIIKTMSSLLYNQLHKEHSL